MKKLISILILISIAKFIFCQNMHFTNANGDICPTCPWYTCTVDTSYCFLFNSKNDTILLKKKFINEQSNICWKYNSTQIFGNNFIFFNSYIIERYNKVSLIVWHDRNLKYKKNKKSKIAIFIFDDIDLKDKVSYKNIKDYLSNENKIKTHNKLKIITIYVNERNELIAELKIKRKKYIYKRDLNK